MVFYSGVNTYLSTIESLRTIQRKIVQAILKEKWNSHTPPLFSKLNFLNVDDEYKLQSLFMYDIYHKRIDETFINMFTPLTDIHHYNTRQKKKTNLLYQI